MITFKIKNLSYRSELEFICNCSFSELEKLVKKRKIDMSQSNLDFSRDDADGITIPTNSPYGIVWCRNVSYTPIGMAILFHEIEHFRNNILRSAGLELTVDTEEAYTYFGTEIIEKVLTRYDKEKKKLTKKVNEVQNNDSK